MKLLSRSLLLAALLLLAAYASSPAWLRVVAARQLPPGWQLQVLETGYPGLSALDIHELRLHGTTAAGDLWIAAHDVRLEYLGLSTAVGEASVDFRPRDVTAPTEPFTLTALSLPLAPPVPALPKLRIERLHVRIRGPSGSLPALDLKGLNLAPLAGGRTRLQTHIRLSQDEADTGTLRLDAGPEGLNGSVRITASAGKEDWAVATFSQQSRTQPAMTRVSLSLDTRRLAPAWLDRLVDEMSGGLVQEIRGKVQLSGYFSGDGAQDPKRVSLHADPLHLSVQEASLLARLLPGFALGSAAPAQATGSIDAEIRQRDPAPSQAGAEPVLVAAIDLNYASETQRLEFRSEDLRLGNPEPLRWDASTAAGQFRLAWALDAPFRYAAGPSPIAAGAAELSSTLNLAAGRLEATGSARLSDARAEALGAAADSIDLRWRNLDLAELTGQLGARSNGLAVTLDGVHLAGIDFDIQNRLARGGGISGHGNALLRGKPLLPLEFTGNTQSAHYHLRLPPATVNAARLNELLEASRIQAPVGLALKQGAFVVEADIDAARDVTATATVRGSQLGLAIQKSSADAGQFELNAHYDIRGNGSDWSLHGPVSAADVALAGGLDLENVRADVTARAGTDGQRSYVISAAEAQLLGGRLALARLQVSAQGLEDTRVELTGIDLSRLLALADIGGLQGSGRLDITLPVGSNDNGIHVNGGSFESTGPGRLAYKTSGAAATNIGLRALENFEFKSLSGHFDYQPDGSFRITARLEGHNPNLYSGHAIVFNLNINGTLPELFEALFLSGDFEQAVLKQIKQH
ncbi:MAG: YdbH domain-containing protein [Lysobacterales bacterium]|jgi:hypothetical protein